ncbi:MAG: acyltransferase, partial [Actinomycetota bacterium]|nr:acyltransferase [Actinomycetota bacterium]
MDVSAAETGERRWAPRAGTGLALAGLALLAGIALALIPFEATPSQPAHAPAVACGTPIDAFHGYDPGPGLRHLLSGQSSFGKDAAPPTPDSLAKLAAVQIATRKYHTCHRPSSVRMGIAGLLMLLGIVPLGLQRRYRWPIDRSPMDEADATFLSGFGYLPAFDGLRAVAISWVITTHLGLRGFFVTGDHGVDLFFVLSGFLITTLLLREHGRTGRVSLRHFYIRRALRLLPVVFLMFIVGAAVRMVGPEWFRSPKWTGLFAMVFYVSNWVHIRDVNALGVLTPTWSLAIEEQFYLVWPPLVAAMLARGRGRRQIALAAGFGALAAAVYRFINTSGRGIAYPFWYYNSFMRADSLLVGCLLAAALSPSTVAYLRRRPRWLSGMAWAGLGGVALVCVKQTVPQNVDFIPVWGLVVLEISFALIVCALVVRPTSLAAAVFSIRPLVWLGRRSYGLYVIHLAIFTAIERNHLFRVR